MRPLVHFSWVWTLFACLGEGSPSPPPAPSAASAPWELDPEELGTLDAHLRLGVLACAARLDCEDVHGAPLTWLPTAPLAPLVPKAALGVACSFGADAPAPALLLDDLVLACDNGWTATIDPSAAIGPTAPADPQGLLFAAAIQRGDAAPRASYWNVLLGLDLDQLASAGTCTLTTRATASDEASCATPSPARYPVIRWHVDLTSHGERLCGRHPLGGPDGAVSVSYTPLGAPVAFAHRMAHGGGGAIAPCPP